MDTTPSPSPSAPSAPSAPASCSENAAEISFLKTQIASLISTANQLNATTIQNETGIKNNTDMIQKVVQSQNDTNTKLANMKKSQ